MLVIFYTFLVLNLLSYKTAYAIQSNPSSTKWDLRRFLKTTSFYDRLSPTLPLSTKSNTEPDDECNGEWTGYVSTGNLYNVLLYT